MKNHLRKMLNVALLLSLIILSSCEKDLYDEAIIENTESKINYVTIDQVPFLIPKIQEFNPDYAFLSSSNKKSVSKETLNLNLDLNHILEYVLSNGLKSYSINIIKEFELNEDKYYENLHLYEKEGEIESFILKYNALDDFKEFNLQDFIGTIEIYDLNYELQGISEIDENRICHNKIINSGWHFWFLGNGTIIIWFDAEYIQPLADDGGGGGGGGGGVDGPSPSNPGTISGPTNPSSTGGNGGVPPVVPNIPTPQQLFVYSLNNSDLIDHVTQFYELSTISQTTILNYVTTNNFTGTNVTRVRNYLVSLMNNTTLYNTLISNPQIQPSLFNYLIQNNFENPNNTFVNQCLSQISSNPGTYNSITPFLIEKQIDDSALDDCTKGVLTQLRSLQQNDIANIFSKLGPTNSVYNVEITSSTSLPVDVLGVTDWSAPLNATVIPPYEYTIKLNTPELLVGGTKLAIASTILHELVHAYFLSLVDDNYMTGNNTLSTFPLLWNFYVGNNGVGADIAQHNQMANSFVNALACSLQEFQTGIPVPSNVQPLQIYKDLAWGGLEDTPPFIALSQIDKDRIQAVNLAEVMNTPKNANSVTYNPISQPCD